VYEFSNKRTNVVRLFQRVVKIGKRKLVDVSISNEFDYKRGDNSFMKEKWTSNLLGDKFYKKYKEHLGVNAQA